jgi:hypothetical protein
LTERQSVKRDVRENNMKCICLIIIISLLFTTLLFSQGSYLERGQSGIGLGADYSSSKNYSTIGGSASYSISGIVDLGASVGKTYYDKKLASEDLSAIYLSPGIEIYAIKQNENMPITISFFASYSYHYYSSDALSLRGLRMSGYGYSIGPSICNNNDASETIKIQPSIGIVYLWGRSELHDDYGNSDSHESSNTYCRLGASLFDKFMTTTVFVVNTVMFIHNDYTTFGIGVGIIIMLQD